MAPLDLFFATIIQHSSLLQLWDVALVLHSSKQRRAVYEYSYEYCSSRAPWRTTPGRMADTQYRTVGGIRYEYEYSTVAHQPFSTQIRIFVFSTFLLFQIL